VKTVDCVQNLVNERYGDISPVEEQSSEVLKHASGDSMRAKRDYAMLAMLFGCGFRRSELVGLQLDEIQIRQGHWAVVDLVAVGPTHGRTLWPPPESTKFPYVRVPDPLQTQERRARVPQFLVQYPEHRRKA
jgi:integrase